MNRIGQRERADQRFTAALHDKQMADDAGRFHGMRQGAIARAKARRGGH